MNEEIMNKQIHRVTAKLMAEFKKQMIKEARVRDINMQIVPNILTNFCGYLLVEHGRILNLNKEQLIDTVNAMHRALLEGFK